MPTSLLTFIPTIISARNSCEFLLGWSIHVPSTSHDVDPADSLSYLMEGLTHSHICRFFWDPFDIKTSMNGISSTDTLMREIVLVANGHWNIGRRARRDINSCAHSQGCGLKVKAQDTDMHHHDATCALHSTDRVKFCTENCNQIHLIPLGPAYL